MTPAPKRQAEFYAKATEHAETILHARWLKMHGPNWQQHPAVKAALHKFQNERGVVLF